MEKNAVVRTAIAAGVAGLGLSVGAVALASADSADESRPAAVVATDRGPGGHGPGGHGPGRHDDQRVADLAEALDLSEEKVAAALEDLRAAHEAEERTALSERLDAAVEAGDLTAADKASVLKAFDAGVLGGPGGHGPR